MFNTWVKKITGAVPNVNSQESARQGAQTFERRSKKRELIDLTEASSFAEEARKQSFALMNRLRSTGGARPTQVPTWRQIKKGVKENLSDAYGFEDLVDEITEKLEDVAEQDPFFKKLVKKL
ncbi:MAG: hypothetical protein IPJ69_01890 [Deltaproteobacteria bacterium]|nr:MAG: hypothetical protein IPJ69_01890 [Deltaproteobacteria bacterium]